MAVTATDRRVQRTHQALRTALYALIQERGVEALTVQDILDRANVGRATFYAHFDNKTDLLVSGLEALRASLKQRQHQALAKQERADEPVFAFSREMFTHANEHRDVFRSMVGKRSGAVIQQLFHKMLIDLVRADVKTLIQQNGAESTPADATAQFIAGGLLGLVIWWVDGRMRMSVDDIDALFRCLAVPAVMAAVPGRTSSPL
jgi:AcrR family transcriptional regulator